jgi:Predicted dehydrogenases and related proteins
MKKIRYAVAGLGHIAQIAVLPAFKHASDLCELTGFISDDPEKIKKLSAEYKVENSWSYGEIDAALSSGEFDALYVALPNDMHKDFVIAAANAGIHILCEKPMALSSEDCREMISAAEKNNVKLMIAYRLHFEKTNMTAVELIAEGKIGNPRIFNSTFTLQVREGNIRTQAEHGGGPLNDIGIYCINAARYLSKKSPSQYSPPQFVATILVLLRSRKLLVRRCVFQVKSSRPLCAVSALTRCRDLM